MSKITSLTEKLQEKQLTEKANRLVNSALSLDVPEYSSCAVELFLNFVSKAVVYLQDHHAARFEPTDDVHIIRASKIRPMEITRLGEGTNERVRLSLDGPEYYYDLYIDHSLAHDLPDLYEQAWEHLNQVNQINHNLKIAHDNYARLKLEAHLGTLDAAGDDL